MSRTDNQIDNKIWQVTVPTPTTTLQTYRSQKIGGNAVCLNPDRKGVLAIWMTLLLNNQSVDPSRFIPWVKKGMAFDVWALITNFAIGTNRADIHLPLNMVGNYALCLKDRPKTRDIFTIVFHPDVLVQAVLHGDEAMVRNILKTNPDLLQIGEGIDFSGREFNQAKGTALTALQAAISAGDFAPNANSTGLCELLVDALKRQHPENWKKIVHDQTLALYSKSLEFYVKQTRKKIRDMSRCEHLDFVAITAEKKRLKAYEQALDSKNLHQIIEAHTNPDPTKAPDAQRDHVIQINQALIDAIEIASDAEIEAVLNDPTIDSPLSNLIKELRKEVDSICQSEIIANPQHLLKLLTLYDAFYDRVRNADSNWKKRKLFWCHLVGYVQRYLPAIDAQIFANSGLFDTVQKGAENTRSFDFKYGGGSIFPLAFDSNSGLGYKFAAGGAAGGTVVTRIFSNLMLSKNNELGGLIPRTSPKSAHSCAMM